MKKAALKKSQNQQLDKKKCQNYLSGKIKIEPTSIAKALSDSSWVEAMQAEILKKFNNSSDVNSALTHVDWKNSFVQRMEISENYVHVLDFKLLLRHHIQLAVKRIFRYLKGNPTLGLWYFRDSPFELVAYTDSDYAGATLDRKSTTGGCQFLGTVDILGSVKRKLWC
ncbi:hypothetical protein Tco_1419345 [Tanacetum coccineum]